MKTEKKLTYSVPEASCITGIGRDKMYALVKAKKVPALRVGNKYLVLAESLEDWVRTAAENHVDIGI